MLLLPRKKPPSPPAARPRRLHPGKVWEAASSAEVMPSSESAAEERLLSGVLSASVSSEESIFEGFVRPLPAAPPSSEVAALASSVRADAS